jgi:hypothetical protein
MKKILVIGLALLYCVTTAGAALLKDDQTLSVSGTGVVQVEPDTAYVRLGVEVVRKTAQEAQADNAATMDKVANAITKLGIAKDKIQTSGFYIYPEMKYEPNQPPKTVGYRCSNQVNITVEDLVKTSKAIDAGISTGANSVQGIQFVRKNDAEFKQLALDKAVKDAAAKAQAIALAAGLKLKGIKNIVESGAAVPIAMDYAVRAMGGAGGAGETPVAPGLMEVRGSVTITYKVE